MENSPVSIDDLEYYDPNAGETTLWNINPPNSKWVSYDYEEMKRKGGRDIDIDEWLDGALVIGNTIYFIHQLYCVSGKYASSLLRNLFISHGVGETLIINNDHHVQCINLSQLLPESPAENAMPNILDYMYNKGTFSHDNTHRDKLRNPNNVRSALLASTLVSAYILRMPELFRAMKQQLASILYDTEKFQQEDIKNIENDLLCLRETVSTKRLKYIMTALCYAKVMHNRNLSDQQSNNNNTNNAVVRRVSFSSGLKSDNNDYDPFDLKSYSQSNTTESVSNDNSNNNANIMKSGRRATVALQSSLQKNLSKNESNVKRYFSEKYRTHYLVNHSTGETYWENEGAAGNEKGPAVTSENNGVGKKIGKKTRHFSVVHQQYYIHDEETNETTWATEKDLEDISDGENEKDTTSASDIKSDVDDANIFENLVKVAETAGKKRRWTKQYVHLLK
jgi:hypothetical protein